FSTLADLRTVNEAAWESIEPKIICSLIDSMMCRYQKMNEKSEKKTHHGEVIKKGNNNTYF
ncbi:hypothetical protein PHYSODRAFT_486679, partial [Phytophthora sojae]